MMKITTDLCYVFAKQVRKVVQWSETFQNGRTQQPRVPSEDAEAVAAVHIFAGRLD